MKKILLTLALVIAMSSPVFAAPVDWDPLNPDYAGTQVGAGADMSANGLIWSRHNLSSYGEHYQATTTTNPSSQVVVTTEVCVFCHTPHHAGSSIAPLWNRNTSAPSAYTAYGSTVAGTGINSVQAGASSLACLSCHDAAITLDNLVNRPGKNTKGGDQGWYFTEINGELIGGGSATSRLNIGTNLSNDHPISVAYQSDRASLRPTSTPITTLVMNQARSFNDNTALDGYGESTNLWSVKGYIKGSGTTIADLLRDGNQVECASCHDPHYKNQTNNDPQVVCSYIGDTPGDTNTSTGDAADVKYCIENPTSVTYGYNVMKTDVEVDGLFLRRVGGNSNSGVCRTCHNK